MIDLGTTNERLGFDGSIQNYESNVTLSLSRKSATMRDDWSTRTLDCGYIVTGDTINRRIDFQRGWKEKPRCKDGIGAFRYSAVKDRRSSDEGLINLIRIRKAHECNVSEIDRNAHKNTHAGAPICSISMSQRF